MLVTKLCCQSGKSNLRSGNRESGGFFLFCVFLFLISKSHSKVHLPHLDAMDVVSVVLCVCVCGVCVVSFHFMNSEKVIYVFLPSWYPNKSDSLAFAAVTYFQCHVMNQCHT